jgi:hypothetical protein
MHISIRWYQRIYISAKYWASSSHYIGSYSYIARYSESMVTNNSRGTSTNITTRLARWYLLPNTYLSIRWYQRTYISAKYWASSGHYIGNYSYMARYSEIMVPNNSRGTSTKITACLARWYLLPNTYQYKMVPKNISFCQILGIFWPRQW